MANSDSAFAPRPGATVNINVSSSSQAVALNASGPIQVRIENDGTATSWINWGKSDVAATIAEGMPVGPGVHEVITVENQGVPIYFAAIAAGSTGKIHFTPGVGL